MSRHFDEWTDADVASLIRMSDRGMTFSEMANELGRSRDSVAGKCGRLQLPGGSERPSKAETLRAFAEALAKQGDITLAALETGISSQYGKTLFAQMRADLGWQAQ